MVLKTAVTPDLSKLIDPTIEMWSSVDDSKRSAEAPIDYWYTAKKFLTPKSFVVLESEIPRDPTSMDSDCFPLVPTRDFWNLQENAIYTGLEDSALMMCRDFFQAQQRPLSAGPSEEDRIPYSGVWKAVDPSFQSGLSDKVLLSFREFQQFQESQSLRGIDDTRLSFIKEFWQFQESQLLRGIDDTRLSFIKEFWQFQESQLLRGIDDTYLAFLREFWKLNTFQVSKGLSDGAILNRMKFLKNQGKIYATGLHDDLLLAFADFWKGVNRTIETNGINEDTLLAHKEFWEKEMVLDEINNCLNLCNSTNTIISDDNNPVIVACLRKLRLDMLTALRKKEANFELIGNFREEQHSKEINDLQKTVGCLFKKLNEISQTIDQRLVNEKLKMTHEIEVQHYQLLSINAKLAFENQELVSNFIKSQEELVTSNANLHKIASTMEKNTEKYLEENCQMQTIIRKLRKRLSSPSTNCATCSTRSKGSRRRNSLSKKRHAMSNSIMPSSLDLIYVDT